jgi:hypothetical protein
MHHFSLHISEFCWKKSTSGRKSLRVEKENNRYLYKCFLTSRRKGRNGFCISDCRKIIYGNVSVGVCFFPKNFCLTLCGWSISARNGAIFPFLGIWASPVFFRFFPVI